MGQLLRVEPQELASCRNGSEDANFRAGVESPAGQAGLNRRGYPTRILYAEGIRGDQGSPICFERFTNC